MIKSFLILILFPIFLFSSQQIIFVVADDFNRSDAKLYFFDGEKILLKSDVNIGKKGLGWGIGEINLTHKEGEPIKKEGDQKAPAGVFKLENIFGYAMGGKYKLPYLHTSKKLICVDDSDSPFYNQIIEKLGGEKSFEYMKRHDNQYEYGVTVLHNKMAKRGRGSCIFLHVEKAKGAGTAGCTSMKKSLLVKIINLLDKSKNPLLIQIPKESIPQILKIYPQLQKAFKI